MKGDLKGIVWIIGSFLAWIIGMIMKTMFHKWDDNKVASLVRNGQNVPAGTRKWQRTPIRMNMPVMRVQLITTLLITVLCLRVHFQIVLFITQVCLRSCIYNYIYRFRRC